jgi:vacuolar-type H+-ATPase subunit E/Vma4
MRKENAELNNKNKILEARCEFLQSVIDNYEDLHEEIDTWL